MSWHDEHIRFYSIYKKGTFHIVFQLFSVFGISNVNEIQITHARGGCHNMLAVM